AVAGGVGELLPLTVRIENIRSEPITGKDDTASYWDSVLMKEIKKRDLPVSFGDYGRKDPFMFLAATEAYKWLKSIDSTLSGRTGLQVEFRELVGGKGGDSAGVSIATAGFSSLRNTPVRQDVAMTGSIRADGAVKAVGMVPTKIAG